MPYEEVSKNKGGLIMSMKFKAHQSFFIRKGWLSKGLQAVEADNTIFMPSKSKDAMDELGIGANQVVALRYWLETAGLIDKGNKEHKLTLFGECILNNDPYIEEIGTLWALHCNIASNRDEATSWYYLFNEYGGTTFTKDSFAKGIDSYVRAHGDGKEVATSSIEADFSCIANTYITHEQLTGRRESPESVIDCPLGELKILSTEGRSNNRTLRKMPANTSMLPKDLVLYAIKGMDGLDKEIKIDTLLNAPCSPGRLFNLDSVALLTKLYELQDSGDLNMTRTAGLDVIRLTDDEPQQYKYLEKYYESIE